MSVISTVHSLNEFLNIIENDLKGFMIDDAVVEKWHKIELKKIKKQDILKIKRENGFNVFLKEQHADNKDSFSDMKALKNQIVSDWHFMTDKEKQVYKNIAKENNKINFENWKIEMNKLEKNPPVNLTPNIIEKMDKQELCDNLFYLDVEFTHENTKEELKKLLTSASFKQKKDEIIVKTEINRSLKRKLDG
tara:strand:+ start:223 stop:798 length:576 start_codon:yes stop_codon:yes gene_type:complete